VQISQGLVSGVAGLALVNPEGMLSVSPTREVCMNRLLRHSLRQLRRNPGFAATAIITLALGVGSSTAIFAILDAVLLQPLPFPQPGRLVAVWPEPDHVASIPTMQDYERRGTAFVSLAAYRQWSPEQKTLGAPLAHNILAVSQGFFSTLGARFALGASWPMNGNEQDCTSQAIVSNAYWNRMGGGSTLDNRTLNLAGRDFSIAAVLPAKRLKEPTSSINPRSSYLLVATAKSGRTRAATCRST